MATELDFAEGSLADGLAENVLADFPLVWQQLDLGCLFLCLYLDLICVADRFVHGCLRLFGWLVMATSLG